MTKILTTHNAEITTASVQVKTLTISGKQVTQSVFRQLREGPLISDDGTLNGVPWGHVNYHPDKCGDSGDHLHIVWQHGSDLFRTAVYSPADSALAFDRVRHFMEMAIAEGLCRKWVDNAGYATDADELGISRVVLRNQRIVRGEWISDLHFFHDGVGYSAEIRKEFYDTFAADRTGWARPHLMELMADLVGPDRTAQDLARDLPSAAYQATWRTLADVPHLFIAV